MQWIAYFWRPGFKSLGSVPTNCPYSWICEFLLCTYRLWNSKTLHMVSGYRMDGWFNNHLPIDKCLWWRSQIFLSQHWSYKLLVLAQLGKISAVVFSYAQRQNVAYSLGRIARLWQAGPLCACTMNIDPVLRMACTSHNSMDRNSRLIKSVTYKWFLFPSLNHHTVWYIYKKAEHHCGSMVSTFLISP